MEKSPDAFRTISEAAEELSLPQHVLRFWETRFSTIKPLKRGGGRRYYRPEDVLLLKGIRHLLYDQGFTIKGVQRILKEQGARFVAGIGEGNPVGALVKEASDVEDDDEVAPMLQLASGHDASGALDAADREKLAGVMRELLDCKRLLERAREN
ncbi:MAG TPA: MerR family transcriptional regulator [Devosia sp.]|nr:MerR family transcriptional regulator [Devosia sp.]